VIVHSSGGTQYSTSVGSDRSDLVTAAAAVLCKVGAVVLIQGVSGSTKCGVTSDSNSSFSRIICTLVVEAMMMSDEYLPAFWWLINERDAPLQVLYYNMYTHIGMHDNTQLFHEFRLHEAPHSLLLSLAKAP
jgi:hypothetical protein